MERGGTQTSPVAVRRRRIPLVALLALVVAVPAVIAAVVAAGSHWFGGSDWALEVLRMSDVGTRHTPLVGVASRFGWSHPGPLLLWAFAPGLSLGGQAGVLGAVGASNGIAAALVVVLAFRRGGAALGVWAFVCTAALVHALGVAFLVDLWNPYPPFLWFVVFVLAVWSVGVGDRSMAPLAVAAGSFAVQAHVGYAPLVLGLPVITAIGAWATGRRVPPTPRARSRWHPLAVASGVFVLAWAAPVGQQIGGRRGNLQAILDYFLHAKDPAAGYATAFGVMGKQLAPFGPWITGRETGPFGLAATASVLPALVLLGVVAVFGWLASRNGARDAGLLAFVAVVASGIGVLATADIRGLVIPYLFRWWWGIAFLLWTSFGWSVWQVAVARWPSLGGGRSPDQPTVDARLRLGRPGTWIGTAVVGAGLVLVGLSAGHATTVRGPFPKKSRAIAALDAQLRPKLRRHTRYLVAIDDPIGLQEVGIGVFAALRVQGYDSFLPSSAGTNASVGSWRTATAASTDATLTVITIPLDDATRASLPLGAHVLASYDPLAPAARAEVTRLSARVRQQLHQRPSLSPFAVSTLHEYQAKLVAEGAAAADVARLAAIEQDDAPFVVYLVPNR